MKISVFDIETTGLMDNLMREDGHIHCLMAQELDYEDKKITKGRLVEFYDVELEAEGDDWAYLGGLDLIPDYLDSFDILAGHGILSYDFPALKWCMGYERKCQVMDSLVISRKNWPDRPGKHSVDAWAPRLGLRKPVQEIWTDMTTDVRHRCREDVLIETEILLTVLEEARVGYEKCR